MRAGRTPRAINSFHLPSKFSSKSRVDRHYKVTLAVDNDPTRAMSGPQQKRSRANTAGDDGDTSQPTTKLWTALDPPPIVCISHEALVKWRRERELYEAAVIARCRESGESLATVMRPVISTIHRRLLKTFCELELKMSVSEMTNDRLKDVKARVLNYFDKFDELIEEYGLSVALDGNEKLKCRLLTENRRPSGLKEQVLLYQDLDPTVKISKPRLFDVIKAEALKNQQSFDLFHSTRDRDSARTTKTAPHSNNGDRNSYKSQKGDQLQSVREDRRDERPMFKKRDAAPAQGCLHCKGTHWVSDCSSATDEQKKSAREAFKDRMDRRRDAEASKMKRVLGDGEDLAPMHVAFNGVVTIPYFPDNGTKYNVIPRRIVEELQQACPDVKVERLRKPIDGKAVGGAIISCDESIQLDLELITPAGKVRMRKVTCIITETEEDEFLLGRPTLNALGIDVEGQLSALANKEIADFDPFESETPMSFDPPDKKKIIARLCELFNEAVANGFPAERKRELFEVLIRYDIWRVAIGNDPPSKIEPFIIQFKEGTLPIRCRPRTYAPAEREWMKV
ncbi:unnamed protein product [Phytophthora fragariaefolia]|uniref:Unnamed protein product n=1 Tax=Phytophthora fragariaefolia TaxID=1490495 RepID=A0A9W6YBI4_9STRA|nr:unnamed protein product [Phytophthora fragariaefolia]